MRIKNISGSSARFNFNWVAVLSLALLIVTSLLIRFFLADFQTGDYIGGFQPWYAYMKNNGGWSAIGEQFGSYNMPYAYLLALASYLPLSDIYAVKLIHVVFDFVAAIWVYLLVKQKYPSTIFPWLGFLAVIFAPTVIFNSSMWAQCDAVYTSFLLGSLYFMVCLATTSTARWSRVYWYGSLVLVFFTLAVSVKLQAVFFILPLLFLLIRRYIPWYLFSIVPLLYILLLLPSYFMGNPWMDLLSVPINQLNYLSGHVDLSAPTAYALLPNAPAGMINKAGIASAVAVVLVFAFVVAGARIKLSAATILLMALLSVLVIPYLLPEMHERYFFPADLIAIVAAFYFPRLWYVPISVISISLFSYIPYMFNARAFSLEVLALAMGIVIVIVAREFILHLIPSRQDLID